MTVLNIEGIGHVNVDDSFTQKTPAEQQAIVEDIARQVGGPHPSEGPSEGTEDAEQAPLAGPQPPGPVQPPTPQPEGTSEGPSGSVKAAMEASLMDGLPASVLGGLATILKTGTNNSYMRGGYLDGAADALYRTRDRLNAAASKVYQRPSSVPTSITDEALHGRFGNALKALGYNLAEGVGPTAGLMVAGAVNPMAALALGADMAADSVNEGRRSAGLKADQGLSAADLPNFTGQTVLNALPVKGATRFANPEGVLTGSLKNQVAGVMRDAASGASKAAQTGLKGSLDSVMNSVSDGAQGGNVGDLKGILENASDAFLQNAGGHGLIASTGVPITALRAATDPIRAGLDFTKGAKELAKAQAENKPLSELSPEAGQALRTANFDAFLTGADASKVPSQLDAHVTDTINSDKNINKNSLLKFAKDAQTAGPNFGGVSKSDADALIQAITQAADHNKALLDDGEANGYQQTPLDSVKALPIDPSLRSALVDQLRNLDLESVAYKKKNSAPIFGPALSNAIHSLPALGVGAGLEMAHTGHVAEGLAMPIVGAIASAAARKLAATKLKGMGGRVDELLGIGRPDILKNMGAKRRVLLRAGVEPTLTPQRWQDVVNEMADNAQAAQDYKANLAAGLFNGPHSSGPSQGPSRGPIPAQVSPIFTAPPTGQQGTSQRPSQAAPQPTPQAPQQGPSQGPFPTINRDVATRYVPGWMSPNAAGALEPNSAKLFNFIQNLRDNGHITPDQFQFLSKTDNIGPDSLNFIKGAIADLQQRGEWDKATQTPKGGPEVVQAPLNFRGPTSGGPSAGAPRDADGNLIRSLYLYNRPQQASESLAANIGQTYPALKEIAETIRDLKSQDLKGAALSTFLAKIQDPTDREKAQIILSPLTKFGRKRK